jgi:hypothetical protein
MAAIPTFWVELIVIISAWLVFAAYVTPKLIAHFMLSRDLGNSALAQKLGSYFVEHMMDWAADPKNQDKLDKVLRNVVATKAAGQVLDTAIDYAKGKLIKTFEGKAGKEIAMFRKGIKGQMPEGLRKLFDNKWLDNAVKAVALIDGVLKTLKGGTQPPEEEERAFYDDEH